MCVCLCVCPGGERERRKSRQISLLSQQGGTEAISKMVVGYGHWIQEEKLSSGESGKSAFLFS